MPGTHSVAGQELERGTMRGMYDGGDLEPVLVDEYHCYAVATNHWPRTAAMLERMAEGWRRDAEREDIEARQRRLRSELERRS